MRHPAPDSGQSSAQSTVEWTGLLLLVALLLVGLLHAAGRSLPGTSLASAVAERIVCAVRLSENCRDEQRLKGPYGHELAAQLRDAAPRLVYELGMTALPVDYRRCRADGCAAAGRFGPVQASESGRRAVAFTHVIDCRGHPRPPTANCSGARAGNLYLQYWFYYPGSATAEGTVAPGAVRRVSRAIGRPSHHPDDWESFQIRIEPSGRRSARASSHHGYNGWEPETDTLYVSGGSHAGRPGRNGSVFRRTNDHRLKLVPLEPIADATRFEVTPPWLKKVWLDPESTGTD